MHHFWAEYEVEIIIAVVCVGLGLAAGWISRGPKRDSLGRFKH